MLTQPTRAAPPLFAQLARAGRLGERLGDQAARQAEGTGYRLLREKNEPGEVCLALLITTS